MTSSRRLQPEGEHCHRECREVAGIALLEALVALVILCLAGLSLVSMMQSALEVQSALRDEERLAGNADRLIAAVTLLKRPELDQRLGRHTVGEFVVDVERPERGLYRIAVAAVAHPETELLTTVVYRPDRGAGLPP